MKVNSSEPKQKDCPVVAKPLNGAIEGKVRSFPFTIDTKALEDGVRRISGWASTPDKDRVKEIIEVTAYKDTLATFNQNPIMLYQHDSRRPIGKFDHLEVQDRGLWVSGTLAKSNADATEVWNLISEGVLKSFSVGFRELEGDYDPEGVWHIKGLELLEISVVSIPANQNAIFSFADGKMVDIALVDDVKTAEDLVPEQKAVQEVEVEATFAFDNGQCVGVTLDTAEDTAEGEQDDTMTMNALAQAPDDSIMAEARRRGLVPTVQTAPQSAVTPLITRGWHTGSCAACGSKGNVMPFAEVRDTIWSLCPTCLLPEGALMTDVTAVERLQILQTEMTAIVARQDQVDTILLSMLAREVRKVAVENGVDPTVDISIPSQEGTNG